MKDFTTNNERQSIQDGFAVNKIVIAVNYIVIIKYKETYSGIHFTIETQPKKTT